MAAGDVATTEVCLMKLELTNGTAVRLCDGGFIDFASDGTSERYECEHPVFGTIAAPGEHEVGFGDQAERGVIAFAPPGNVALTDWYGDHLLDARLRTWAGELDADGKTVGTAELLDDLLVDTYEQTIGARGSRLLELGFISRTERFFLRNEGNVCSSPFHQSIYPGELGFNNCTDKVGYLAWGALAPARGGVVGGGILPGSTSPYRVAR
mgnify:CR=1 FL=1